MHPARVLYTQHSVPYITDTYDVKHTYTLSLTLYAVHYSVSLKIRADFIWGGGGRVAGYNLSRCSHAQQAQCGATVHEEKSLVITPCTPIPTQREVRPEEVPSYHPPPPPLQPEVGPEEVPSYHPPPPSLQPEVGAEEDARVPQRVDEDGHEQVAWG